MNAQEEIYTLKCLTILKRQYSITKKFNGVPFLFMLRKKNFPNLNFLLTYSLVQKKVGAYCPYSDWILPSTETASWRVDGRQLSDFFYRTRRELERWLVEGGEGMREEYALVSRLVLKLNQGACAAGHRVDNRHLLQTSRNDGSRTLKERIKKFCGWISEFFFNNG